MPLALVYLLCVCVCVYFIFRCANLNSQFFFFFLFWFALTLLYVPKGEQNRFGLNCRIAYHGPCFFPVNLAFTLKSFFYFTQSVRVVCVCMCLRYASFIKYFTHTQRYLCQPWMSCACVCEEGKGEGGRGGDSQGGVLGYIAHILCAHNTL